MNMLELMAGLLLATGLAAAPAVVAGQATTMDNVQSTVSTKSAPLPRDSVYQLPLQLTDQHGKRSDWRLRRGKPQVVAMFYSSCRYICPLIIESAKSVDRSLTPAQRDGLGVMFISMDPARDTPQALTRLIKDRRIDPRWMLASPLPDDVRSVAGVLDVRYRQMSDGEFNHTSALVLLDADGRIIARTEKIGSKPDPEFIAAVKQLL